MSPIVLVLIAIIVVAVLSAMWHYYGEGDE